MSSTLTWLVAAAGVLLLAAGRSSADNPPRDFKGLLEIAKQLESAEMKLTSLPADITRRRRDLLYAFARESKRTSCEAHYDQLLTVVGQYKLKALSFVDNSKNSNNWLSGIAKLLVSPMGAMKSLSKFDPNLAAITSRYEAQESRGLLTHSDVDCDMIKFQIRVLNGILFVLQTEIQYLIMESRQIINRAIYDQLKADSFLVFTNFYTIQELSSRQSDLLLEFLASRADVERSTIAESVDRFHSPGPYVIGRLLEACHELPRYLRTWLSLESDRPSVCSSSLSDPQDGQFASRLRAQTYAPLGEFCDSFLEAL